MVKQFHVIEREVLIRIYLIEAKSKAAYERGEYQTIEMIDEDCVEGDILNIEELD